MAYELWSLDITYDLTPILHMPTWAGKVSISGLLNWGNALGTAEADGTLKDVLFGGMSVNWTWGGG